MIKKLPPPKGFHVRKGFTKIAVSFPDELFKKIKRRTEKSGLTFSEVVSDLSACGLLDIEDSEMHEPVQATAHM
jgi:metal-responsive CopG/Arc/MetJ family transcriptional regulator